MRKVYAIIVLFYIVFGINKLDVQLNQAFAYVPGPGPLSITHVAFEKDGALMTQKS